MTFNLASSPQTVTVIGGTLSEQTSMGGTYTITFPTTTVTLPVPSSLPSSPPTVSTGFSEVFLVTDAPRTAGANPSTGTIMLIQGKCPECDPAPNGGRPTVELAWWRGNDTWDYATYRSS